MFNFFVFLLLSQLVFAQDDPIQNNAHGECLNRDSIYNIYLLGDFERVKWEWIKFEKAHGKISPTCAYEKAQYLGIINLFLNNDTASSVANFNQVLDFDPKTMMWRFRLPISIQAFYDNLQSEWFIDHYTLKELWPGFWIPPTYYPASSIPSIRKLQDEYCKLRLKFALSKNRTTYYNILEDLKSLSDPVSIPFRAEVRTRLGIPPNQILNDLSLYEMGDTSKIIPKDMLQKWVHRLYVNSKDQISMDINSNSIEIPFGRDTLIEKKRSVR